MEEALIKRVLPHSIEAEQSVVGAMLMDKDAIVAASETISREDFYQVSYGIIFESMVELFNEGKPADLITLQDFQSGICTGADYRGAYLGKCEILCADRI